MPTGAAKYVPGIQRGSIRPEHLAGMIGLPYVGRIIYVDPSAGSDTGNSGGSQKNALKTIASALAKATAGKHDVVIVAPSGGIGRTADATAITWNKRFTHLVGSAAPTIQDARAGIEFATGGSLAMSENGCVFKNLTFTSSADIDVTVALTGNYNSFHGVDFKGNFNATSADSTPWRALTFTGAQENAFYGCTFGSDTMSRGVANATISFASASSRNVFEGCRFVMHNDTANSPVHIFAEDSNSIDRWLEFRDTTFYSFWTNKADKTQAVVDFSTQTATADILMTGNTMHVNFDDWEAVASGIISILPRTATTNAVGQAVNPTVG